MSLKDYRVHPASGHPAQSAVVLLHGLGDSGSGGLLEIGRVWQRVLPNTVFLCPDAPYAYDMGPSDFGGRQWFSLREFTDESVKAGVRKAAPILNDYLDGVLKEFSITPNKLALVGFSQGTMMSLYSALRRQEPVAAVVGYSGMLTEPETLATEKKSAPPILLVHGTQDEVVPFQAMGAAERVLKENNISVRTVACQRLGHSIDNDGLMAGMRFLQQYLQA